VTARERAKAIWARLAGEEDLLASYALDDSWGQLSEQRLIPWITAAIEAAVAAEREACARLAAGDANEEGAWPIAVAAEFPVRRHIAAAIRARGAGG
jgi:hypothetical protein